MLLAIPLAWLQLIHQRVRFVATLIGISLVVALLFVQVGFQDALFNSAVRVHENLQGELFMVSAQYKALTAQQFFPRSRLYQTLASEQVASVSPLLHSVRQAQKYRDWPKIRHLCIWHRLKQPAFPASWNSKQYRRAKISRSRYLRSLLSPGIRANSRSF